MSTLQLASVPLNTTPDGWDLRAVLEWQKGGTYRAMIVLVLPGGTSNVQECISAGDVADGLRNLAKLVDARRCAIVAEQLRDEGHKADQLTNPELVTSLTTNGYPATPSMVRMLRAALKRAWL